MRPIRRPLLLLAALLCACGKDSGQAPDQTTPAPESFAEIAPLINWESPGLAGAASALAAGDSAGAADGLLAHFLAAAPITAPHQEYGNPTAYADQLLSGRLSLPPHPETELPDDPAWNEDPFGDVNWRFQYHTLRWLAPLWQAFEATGDSTYLTRLLFLMEDYAGDNLPGAAPSDMTWYDMAASLRIEHWLYFWKGLLAGGLVDRGFMLRFIEDAQVHGEMLGGAIPYNETSNHGTYHNRSLIALGLVLPELASAADWLAVGSGRLEEQIIGMVSPHGVHLEQSPAYHISMMSLARTIQDLLAESGGGLSALTESYLAGMPRFAAHILKPNGSLPMISDSALQISLSALLGMDEKLDYSASGGQQGARPSERYLSYPVTGYVILRSGWGETRPFGEETQVVFDTGPRGSWHGHDDALTFTFSALGRDLVVDSGFYTYNSDAWRDWFTSPPAHNVLLRADSDGRGRAADPQRLVWRTGPAWAFQSALLDLGGGRDWTRCLVYLAPDEALLLDFTHGEGEEALELLFHLHPDAAVSADGPRLRAARDGAVLDLWPLDAPTLALIEGATDPIQGWYSPAYGSRRPNVAAAYRLAGRRLDFVTLLHAHAGDDPLVDFRLDGARDEECYRLVIERTSGTEHVTVWPATGRVEREP
ncbi:MAG: alginate lyase family protein [Candidatus Krumholzibacteriota bacterium]|nr:alginate lyase family protein [Candidatus Krumholzibacteriota bacterium]